MNVKEIIKKHSMSISLCIIFIAFSMLTGGRLLHPQNLSNLLLQNSYVLIMACGMLLCILTGGNVDLSVGATVCLVGAIAAQLMSAGIPALPTILICMVIAVLIGIWNGFWIGYMHIPPFICTLAGMFLFRGLGRAILQSQTVVINNETFLNIFTYYIHITGLDDGDVVWSSVIIGAIIAAALLSWKIFSRKRRKLKGYTLPSAAADYGKIGVAALLIFAYCWRISYFRGISVMAIWIIAILLIYAFITSKTAFGRYFYSVGGNEKASALSGINTKKVYFVAYTSMSLLAGLAALIVSARIGSVNGDTGNSYEMDAIAACFIGGASAYGGSGKVTGVLIGGILLGVINQGMSIIGIDSNWQYVIKGAVLLAAVIFDVISNRKTGKAG